MYQHAIDNLKLIAEIHVLASETFKAKLCWERSKKCYESKSTVLPQNLSTIVAIVAMFLFAIMISLTCTCTFAWGDDYSYSVVSYKFLKDEISFRESKISSRPNDISFRGNEIPLRSKRNFVLMTRHFVSINHLACEILPALEQQKHRNFAAFSSEAKVRNLIAEIRVISLISANFVCISFAQYCSSCPTPHHSWTRERVWVTRDQVQF